MGRSNLHAVKYDRVRIPLTATYQEAKQIYAYNAAMTRREHAEYIWRTYEGQTNNTRYDVPRYDAGAQQWADLKALINVPVGVAEGLANGVVTLTQVLSPIYYVEASIRGDFETWQPFEADNASQQLGHLLSVPVSAAIAPETILLRAATTAPRAYTGLRAVKTWEDVGVPAASNGARSAIADSLSGSGRAAAQAVEGRVAANSGKPLTIASNPVTGNPAAISRGFGQLNTRQAAVLEQLPEYGSSTIVPKSFGQGDIAALTAQTGDEFAMFSTGGRRLIYRGNANSVPITPELAEQLAARGWRWSNHTHPGFDTGVLRSSIGDRAVLDAMGGQRSSIFNSMGQRSMFTPRGDSLEGWRPQ